jgi:3',5'-cyclic AMP phosphodiesterase CpdA
MFVLAHLSDPHLGPLPRLRARELAGKRVLGFYNWHRSRKNIHRPETLDAIVSDLKAHKPDHIALTGDLTNLSLPEEFAAAHRWLEAFGTPREITVVPGNHDYYVRRRDHGPHTLWSEFMRGDDGADFPFLRRRGPLALIGLSSAIATAPFMATGTLGQPQVDHFATLLAGLAGQDVFRCVLVHHPPVTKTGDRFKRLIDADAFRRVVKMHGADLVLHGHDHVHSVHYLEGPDGARVPVVGVPSASVTGGHGDPAAYNLYRIAKRDNAWHCEAVTRGFRRHGPEIVQIASRSLV